MGSDIDKAGSEEEAYALMHDGFAADRKTAERMRSEIGVLSLAGRPDSLLMWAHYADQHRGFLIEFDPAHEFFRQRQSRNDPFHHLRRVRYRRERPSREIDDFVDASTLLTKSTDWSYEMEWRMLIRFPRFAHEVFRRRGQVVHLVSLPPSCITSVILGARMSERSRARFEQIVDTHYPQAILRYAELDKRLFQVVLPDGEYYFDAGRTSFFRAMRAADRAQARTLRAVRPVIRSAIADLNRAQRLSPSSAKSIFIRALAHRILGELQPAIADCTRALELDDGSLKDDLHTTRAVLFARLGLPKEAAQDLDRIENPEKQTEATRNVLNELRSQIAIEPPAQRNR
jgi:tetratricopeptide (TPR) repeat protein